MADINFPASPATGDTHTAGGKTWRFNGVAWRLQPTNSTPGVSADGRVATYAGLAGLSPSGGDTYLVEADSMFYVYDTTLGWPAQGSGIEARGGVDGRGSAFPGSPTLNDRFYRTDLHMWAYWDGGRWLSEQEYSSDVSFDDNAGLSASPLAFGRMEVRSDYAIYLTRWAITLRNTSTNTGSVYWTVDLSWQSQTLGNTVIASVNTASDTSNQYTAHDVNINTALTASAKILLLLATKTGAPGTLLAPSSLFYRLILG